MEDSEALRGARMALGLSQPAMAARLRVSLRTYSRWENGWVQPKPAAVELAEVWAAGTKRAGARKK